MELVTRTKYIELNTWTKYIGHEHELSTRTVNFELEIEHVQEHEHEHEGGHEHWNELNNYKDSTSNSKSTSNLDSTSNSDQNSTLNTMNSGDIDTLFVADVFSVRNSFFQIENKLLILSWAVCLRAATR